MPITRTQLAERVFREVAASASEERTRFTLADVRAMMLGACATLADRAVTSAEVWRHYLTKSYTAAPTAGVFSLATGFDDMLVESLPRATLTHDDSPYPLVYLPDPQDLYYPQIGADFIYYALDGRSIRTQDTQGQIDTLTTNITIRNAVFEPIVSDTANLTTVPDVLEDALVEILKAMVVAKIGAGAAA